MKLILSLAAMKISNPVLGVTPAAPNETLFRLSIDTFIDGKMASFISHFDSEFVLRRCRFDFPSMVIAIVRRHLALSLEKQRVGRADA